ncbi:type II secretion system protein GspN [Desulfuromonas soudanensis]|uniref:Type II secretion system protein GspN n=1 Tax=Desulfuromonas soudanensis TaxID=1603606 RepID=A0A0M4CUU0_9BACT|nr:type II secretion system protein GspN [Desulfuromonas soudanensis]ALC15354.1 type II secretion system protein GspN [Desulfuromonas soudanensis]
MRRFRFSLPGALRRKPRTTRGISFYLGAFAVLLSGALLGFYLFFPTAALQARLEGEISSRTPVRVELAGLNLLFPPGLGSQTLTVRPPLPDERAYTFDRLRLRPLWLTLFTSRPGVQASAGLQGGTIELSARRGGSVTGELHRIPFDEQLAPGSSLQIGGTVNSATLLSAFPLQATTESALHVQLGAVQLRGLKNVGAAVDTLNLGTLTLEGSGKGTALKINQLKGEGGDLAVSGTGTLLLAQPLQRSRINLNVTLKPSPRLDRALLDLLELLVKPARDGSYLLRLSGTLGNPVLR